MNFKLLLFLFFISSCGLKTKPQAPKNTTLPSIPDSYYTHPDVPKEINEQENKDLNNEKK